MRYKKLKAFTLAEVMILLLTLSILMAAFAPVFTRRYNNASSDDVWAFVSGDDNEDAYFDSVNKAHTSQAFIGLTPADDLSVKDMSSDSSSNVLYSKLVIAAGNNVQVGLFNRKQNQILFRYGSGSTGAPVGALFADGSNFLLGGLYNNTVTGKNNTAFGSGSLQSLTSGNRNTAVGKDALNKLTSGEDNTAVGHEAGAEITSGSNNTAVGYKAYGSHKRGEYNTAIGYNSMSSADNVPFGNTAVGSNSLLNVSSGSYNTAIGYNSMTNLTSGYYNTAIGYNSMTNLTTGYYNTAVGAHSCNHSSLTTNSYKTCIGYNSGNSGINELYNSDVERVFIGAAPKELIDGKSYSSSAVVDKPAAVLEVHNISHDIASDIHSERPDFMNSTSTNAGNLIHLYQQTLPIPFMGYSSVVINGNLIVRGNSYFETPIKRQSNMLAASYANWHSDNKRRGDIWYEAHIPKGLVLYTIGKLPYDDGIEAMYAFDGYRRTESSWETCRGGCGRGSHAFHDVRPNCICTAVNSQTDELVHNSGLKNYGRDNIAEMSDGNSFTIGKAKTNFDTTYDRYEISRIIKGSTSYDWASKTFAVSSDNSNARSPYNGTAKIFPSKFGGESVSCNNFYDRNGDIPYQTNTGNSPSASKEQPFVNAGAYYKDRSFNKYIYLERRPSHSRGGYDNDGKAREWEYGLKSTDKPYAHIRLEDSVGGYNIQYSCCPVLTDVTSDNDKSPYKDLNNYSKMNDFQLSDRRLKDIGERFTAGIEQIRKINVYNYTFKTDNNKVPQVGVIAQDLRMVFPNAVSKDKNGYYQIRWDEMFYAAINSIKTLYSKAESLIAQVAKDQQRVSNLKADTKELNAKLDNLEKELSKLESENH